MKKTEIFNFIYDELVDFGIEENEISSEAKMFDDIGLDSTETVDLSLTIKKQYSVLIDFGGKIEMTIEDLVEEIYSKLEKEIG